MTALTEEIESAVAAVRAGVDTWARTPLSGRRRLLEQIHDLTAKHAEQWVRAAAGIKGLAEDSPLVGEEWQSGPYPLLTATAALAESVGALAEGRSPVEGYPIDRAPGNRSAIKVLPHGIFDTLLLNGFTAEVWTKPGVDATQVRAKAGLAQRKPQDVQGVCAVLGAGNIFSIAPLDVLYQLFAYNRVVVLKLNPVTDPMLPVFEGIFAPAIEQGLVAIVTGGAEVGKVLIEHPDVTAIHMTGSEITHDAIVFGTGPEGAGRKAANEPLIDKPITSELGGISPTIVLPGEWSDADLEFQARHVATQRLHNNGYNCVAAQVVAISADWKQKDAFLAALRKAFAEAPARPDYYPGSAQRVAAARAAYPQAETFGPNGERTLVPGVRIDAEEHALHTEYFAPVLGVIELSGTGKEFLREAVRTANEQFHGTLGVNLIAHPKTIQALGGDFEAAITELRYGTIAVNAWTAVGYLTATASWGAFPGHTIDDVQSGIGVVHNALLIEEPERTIIRGPFRPAPRSILNGELTLSPVPPWFVSNRTAATTGRRLAGFAAAPGWGKLPALFASALRG